MYYVFGEFRSRVRWTAVENWTGLPTTRKQNMNPSITCLYTQVDVTIGTRFTLTTLLSTFVARERVDLLSMLSAPWVKFKPWFIVYALKSNPWFSPWTKINLLCEFRPKWFKWVHFCEYGPMICAYLYLVSCYWLATYWWHSVLLPTLFLFSLVPFVSLLEV